MKRNDKNVTIRPGTYFSPDGTASLSVVATDNGVRLEFADFTFDLYEAWTISGDAVSRFEYGDVKSSQIEDMQT